MPLTPARLFGEAAASAHRFGWTREGRLVQTETEAGETQPELRLSTA